jgi:hypothetical protein
MKGSFRPALRRPRGAIVTKSPRIGLILRKTCCQHSRRDGLRRGLAYGPKPGLLTVLLPTLAPSGQSVSLPDRRGPDQGPSDLPLTPRRGNMNVGRPGAPQTCVRVRLTCVLLAYTGPTRTSRGKGPAAIRAHYGPGARIPRIGGVEEVGRLRCCAGLNMAIDAGCVHDVRWLYVWRWSKES